jgi:Holliday junction resolvasome RuvABC DNA-binding subunit
LLVELKSRLAVPDVDVRGAASGSAPGVSAAGSARSDVRDALANLGYGPEEVRDALFELPDDGDSAALLKQALQRLALARR